MSCCSQQDNCFLSGAKLDHFEVILHDKSPGSILKHRKNDPHVSKSWIRFKSHPKENKIIFSFTPKGLMVVLLD
jgi:hypothetical protein